MVEIKILYLEATYMFPRNFTSTFKMVDIEILPLNWAHNWAHNWAFAMVTKVRGFWIHMQYGLLSMKKKMRSILSIRKITLKIRIVLFLTFNSKTTEWPKTFYGRFRSSLALYLLTTKLSCFQKNNFGQINLPKPTVS